jgi:hypothetical protein
MNASLEVSRHGPRSGVSASYPPSLPCGLTSPRSHRRVPHRQERGSKSLGATSSGENGSAGMGAWARSVVRVPHTPTASVRIESSEIVRRRSATWAGISAEIVQVTRLQEVEVRFAAPVHLGDEVDRVVGLVSAQRDALTARHVLAQRDDCPRSATASCHQCGSQFHQCV